MSVGCLPRVPAPKGFEGEASLTMTERRTEPPAANQLSPVPLDIGDVTPPGGAATATSVQGGHPHLEVPTPGARVPLRRRRLDGGAGSPPWALKRRKWVATNE